jgi:hypothetical protein
MVSGDNVLPQQVYDRFPLAEFGLVKRAKGRADAELLPLRDAQANIERAAKRAIEKLDRFKPFPVASEYRFEISFQNRAQANRAALYPSLERVNETTLGYTTPDFIMGYNRSKALIRMATADRLTLLMEAVKSRPDHDAILAEYERLLLTRWLEREKMPAQAAAPEPAQKKKRYHGDN